MLRHVLVLSLNKKKGAGVFVTDDMYNAQLTVGNTTSDLGSTEIVMQLKFQSVVTTKSL